MIVVDGIDLIKANFSLVDFPQPFLLKSAFELLVWASLRNLTEPWDRSRFLAIASWKITASVDRPGRNCCKLWKLICSYYNLQFLALQTVVIQPKLPHTAINYILRKWKTIYRKRIFYFLVLFHSLIFINYKDVFNKILQFVFLFEN